MKIRSWVFMSRYIFVYVCMCVCVHVCVDTSSADKRFLHGHIFYFNSRCDITNFATITKFV